MCFCSYYSEIGENKTRRSWEVRFLDMQWRLEKKQTITTGHSSTLGCMYRNTWWRRTKNVSGWWHCSSFLIWRLKIQTQLKVEGTSIELDKPSEFQSYACVPSNTVKKAHPMQNNPSSLDLLPLTDRSKLKLYSIISIMALVYINGEAEHILIQNSRHFLLIFFCDIWSP